MFAWVVARAQAQSKFILDSDLGLEFFDEATEHIEVVLKAERPPAAEMAVQLRKRLSTSAMVPVLTPAADAIAPVMAPAAGDHVGSREREKVQSTV